MSTLHAPTSSTTSVATPVITSATRTALWVLGAFLVAMGLYYFVGIDQGAYSVFGSDMHVHEFVHDSRHFLGFPCH